MIDASDAADQLLLGFVMQDDSVVLHLVDFRIQVRSNSKCLLQRLRDYFAHVIATDHSTENADFAADVVVHAVESSPIDFGIDFVDWRRELGKTGRKDEYCDLNRNGHVDGRLIRKVRTRMLFLQSDGHRIARGPCLANDNQVINFINCQYMNRLRQRGAVICHASCVGVGDRGLAIAGFSGGGKSSLMLRLLENPGVQFLTNDRLFIGSVPGAGIRAIGIPKLPRVNPGTILSRDTLHPILDQRQRDTFESLSKDQLWDLEQKFDVDISKLYGDGRIIAESPLTDVLILNWQRTSDARCQITRVDIDDRPDLLVAVEKSPGPFYCDSDGVFQSDDHALDHRRYIELLNSVNVWEASGAVDFEFAADRCREIQGGVACRKTC
jgi:HprK-related kinase B